MKKSDHMWIGACLALLFFFVFLALRFEIPNMFPLLKQLVTAYDATDKDQVIFVSRIARVLVACLVGAGLAISGLMMQLQYDNDLADPSLMGVSDGSALVVAFSMVFLPQLSMLQRMTFSIAGAFVAYLLVTGIFRMTLFNRSPLSFPLIGIVVSTMLNSLTKFLVSYFNLAQSVSAWYNSRLYRTSMEEVVYFMPILLLFIMLLLLMRKQMDVYAFGEELTVPLGMNRKAFSIFFSLTVVCLTGISVAIAGRIAFVGLIVPHIVKLIVGKRYTAAVVLVPILGALLVVASDYLSIFVNYPFETPVGLVIALLGVPLFLFLIRRGAGIRYE